MSFFSANTYTCTDIFIHNLQKPNSSSQNAVDSITWIRWNRSHQNILAIWISSQEQYDRLFVFFSSNIRYFSYFIVQSNVSLELKVDIEIISLWANIEMAPSRSLVNVRQLFWMLVWMSHSYKLLSNFCSVPIVCAFIQNI